MTTSLTKYGFLILLIMMVSAALLPRVVSRSDASRPTGVSGLPSPEPFTPSIGIEDSKPPVKQVWTKPADWPATREKARSPYMPYYEKGELPLHEPVDVDDLGLEWQLPLRQEELLGRRFRKIGGAFAPTMKGRKRGSWRHRYKRMHRGNDMGLGISRLKGRKIPVHAVADGIFDGTRVFKLTDDPDEEWHTLVVYHFAKNGTDKIYTSVYCHVDPLPGLEAGKEVKGGDVIGNLADPEGMWHAHVHLEMYSRPAYSSKDSTKRSLCGCRYDRDCDAQTVENKAIPRGCGIFEDDLYLLEPYLFIKKQNK